MLADESSEIRHGASVKSSTADEAAQGACRALRQRVGGATGGGFVMCDEL